ncbi:MAG: universal stress protein [Acidimicrobiales bacterium]
MYSVIVVGTDGSDTANVALRQALDLAATGDATVHIVSAYQPGSGASGQAGTAAEHWHINPESQSEAILAEAAATARGKGVKAETHGRRGDPADAIIDVATEVGADAVVVGNKGMKGAKRFLLGSIPNKVAHNAPCTVIVVKTT